MSAITDELHNLVAALEAEGHALADKARAILARLRGDESQLATDAEADVQQVETDAAPVVAEAETDAGQLKAEIGADAHDLTTPPATPTA